MGFYDSAFKNIGSQIGYAGGVIGGYLFHQRSKEKSDAANKSSADEIAAFKKQKADFEKRKSELENRIAFQESIINDQQKEIKAYQKGVGEATEMIKGLIK